MSQSPQKNISINIRAHKSQRDLIDKAVFCKRKNTKTNRTDFILESACREAENFLLDQRLFIVDDKTYQAFNDLLESPVDENLELQALLKSKSPWEK